MNKIEKLGICINLLSIEHGKICRKYNEIDDIINEDVTLTARKFKNLDKKRSSLLENSEALELGILILANELGFAKRAEKRDKEMMKIEKEFLT